MTIAVACEWGLCYNAAVFLIKEVVMGILFRRRAYDEMLDWKNRLADKYALLVEGARRVGKTFLLRRFVSNEYKPKSVSWMSHAEARRGRERRERYHYQVELRLCRE